MSAQPEAIRCAEELERSHPMLSAAELRRLHALNEELLAVLLMVQESAIDKRGEDFNLTTEQWAVFHAVKAKATGSAS